MTSSYNTASRLVGQTYTGSAGVPGNLTYTDATGTTTYTRDARNRLSALSSSTLNATFTYDALGRRTGKTINGQGTTFLYDGLDTVKESGPEGEASYLRTLGIDEALSRTDAAGRLTYLPDALGCIPALADNAGGLLTTYTYAPFGDTATTGAPNRGRNRGRRF